MAKFQITWEDGREETVEQSDCATLEQFLNCRFGAGKTPGAKVVQLDKVEKATPKAKKKVEAE